MTRNIRLAYFASGSGSSVEALHHKIQDGRLGGFESALIICNKTREEAGIHERGERLGIETIHAPDHETQNHWLNREGADLVLGLGYTGKVHEWILNSFQDRVLNIHPTLLPKHGGRGMYGLATHMAVLASGSKFTGPTVHLMNEEYDKGRILRQVRIPIPDHLIGKATESNAVELQKYVLEEEYRAMTQTLEDIRNGRIQIGLDLSSL